MYNNTYFIKSIGHFINLLILKTNLYLFRNMSCFVEYKNAIYINQNYCQFIYFHIKIK